MRATTFVTLSLATGALLGATGVAQADTIQNLGPYAGDVLNQLSDWGYTVMLNGVGKDAAYLDDHEKWACMVNGIHPTVSGPLATGQFQTVYVDLSCPTSNNGTTNGSGT